MERWLFAAVVVVTLLPRAVFMVTLPLHDFELIPFEGSFADSLHAPLHPLFVSAWSHLGAPLGWGLEPWWLRLPNVALCGAFVWLLFRTARFAGMPLAGVLAAVVFAVTPSCINISVFQEHYLAEMVVAMWFLERLQWYLAEERRIPRSLWVATAVCAWTGFVTAFVVVPGLAVLVLTAFRRGQLRALFKALAVTVACCLPPIFQGLAGLTDHLGFISLRELSGPLRDEQAAALGHSPLSAADGVGGGSFLRFVPELMGAIVWRNGSIWLSLMALPALAAAVRRPIAAVVVVAVVAMGAAGMVMYWAEENTAFLWVPLVFVCFLGSGLGRHAWSRFQVVRCAVLLGGILFVTWGLPPETAVKTDALRDPGLREIAVALEKAPQVDLVVLYNCQETAPILHALCDADSWDLFRACTMDLKQEMTSEWEFWSGVIRGRSFYAIKSFGIPTQAGRSHLEAVVDRWGVRERPHLVLARIDVRSLGEISASLPPAECAVMTRTPGYILYQCPGQRADPTIKPPSS